MVRLQIFFIFFFIVLINIVSCVDNAQNNTLNVNEYTFPNQYSSGRSQKLEYGTRGDGSLQFSLFNDHGQQKDSSNTGGIRNRVRQIGRLLHVSRRLSNENGNRQLTKSIFFGRGRLLR